MRFYIVVYILLNCCLTSVSSQEWTSVEDSSIVSENHRLYFGVNLLTSLPSPILGHFTLGYMNPNREYFEVGFIFNNHIREDLSHVKNRMIRVTAMKPKSQTKASPALMAQFGIHDIQEVRTGFVDNTYRRRFRLRSLTRSYFIGPGVHVWTDNELLFLKAEIGLLIGGTTTLRRGDIIPPNTPVDEGSNPLFRLRKNDLLPANSFNVAFHLVFNLQFGFYLNWDKK